jgi:hypothetical protein
MRFRKLRIAWSVWWGIVCMLLIVLWVRSYRYVDGAFFKVSNGVFVLAASLPGAIDINIYPEEYVLPGTFHLPTKEWLRAQGGRKRLGFLGAFQWDNHGVLAPDWFWLLMLAIVAIIPWLPWRDRFSLRTLLVATTLVAILLGLIVWLR